MCPNPHRTYLRFIHRPSSSAANASHPYLFLRKNGMLQKASMSKLSSVVVEARVCYRRHRVCYRRLPIFVCL